MSGNPIPKGSEAGAPRCATTGELKRTCSCRPCIGRRSRSEGLRKQRLARRAAERATGRRAARFAGQLGNEESWQGLPVRIEVKSGDRDTLPVAVRFLACEDQSEANRPIGDVRPFVAVLMPPGWGCEGLVICRLSQWRDISALIGGAA